MVELELRIAGIRSIESVTLSRPLASATVNFEKDHELCFPDGDCAVYLREPGRSTGDFSFLVHSSQLAQKGFQCLLDQCMLENAILEARPVSIEEVSSSRLALYLPAPFGVGKDELINYHLATRNLFAWIYDLPMTGRTLGKAIVSVLLRIAMYRFGSDAKNQLDMISYLESQKYLDFRECVDHALSTLHFAEIFEVESLWIDAFAHCVGLNHTLHESMEFSVSSPCTLVCVIRPS